MGEARGSAAEQLRRLLYLLPAGAEGPLALREAAERLEVSEQTVLDDLVDVTAREFYHPAGGADDIRVEIDGDRFRVHSHGKFRRPPRLNPREALAVDVALRRFAAQLRGKERDDVLELATRIGRGLSTEEPSAFAERFSVEESGESGGIRLALRRAAAERRRCRIVYVRVEEPEPRERELDPYEVVESRGTWYVIGYCGLREDVRVFRIDRIVDLEVTDERFEVPADFDPDDWIEAGRVFRSDATESVTVRYTGGAAARIREQGPTEPSSGGGVKVTYDVADTGWIVRQVLQQAGEAEVLAPERVRREVARAAARMAAKEPPAD